MPSLWRMATVADLPREIRVCQFYNDHDPPHFHVRQAGANVLIRIADLTVLRGAMSSSDLLLVQEWARNHQAEQALNWVLARAGLDVWEIPYP
jgi:hypothetical protein